MPSFTTRVFRSRKPVSCFRSSDVVGNRDPEASRHTGIQEAPLPCLAALLLTASACVALFFVPEPVYQLLQLLLTRQE